jgi:hypothetical protein
MSTTYPDPRPGEVLDGDGTVPRVSTLPIEPAILSRGYHRAYFAEKHGSIQNSIPVLVHLSGILSEALIKTDRFRQRLPRLQLNIEDAYLSEAPVRLSCRSDGPPLGLRAIVDSVLSNETVNETILMSRTDGSEEAFIDGLKPGPYRVTVIDKESGASISDVFLVV